MLKLFMKLCTSIISQEVSGEKSNPAPSSSSGVELLINKYFCRILVTSWFPFWRFSAIKYLTINTCWTTMLQRSSHLWTTWQHVSKYMTTLYTIVPSKCCFNWGKMQMFKLRLPKPSNDTFLNMISNIRSS